VRARAHEGTVYNWEITEMAEIMTCLFWSQAAKMYVHYKR
jgi:hypothetical protein